MSTMDVREHEAASAAGRDLVPYAAWLVRLRWMAVAGVVVAALLGRLAFHAISDFSLEVLLGCAVAMLAYNTWLSLRARRMPFGAQVVSLQILFDLVALTLMLHVTGGIENPFHLLYMFNIVIAGILLPRGAAYAVSFASCVFLGGTTVLQMAKIVPAFLIWPEVRLHGFDNEPGTWMHASGELIAFAVMSWGTAYLATTIVARLRAQEREAAAAREALQRERAQSELQLVRAAKIATAGELAAHVAHEVNNPIAIISAKGRLLLSDHRGEISEWVAADLVKIVDQADRVARIAQGLLSSCRPTGGARTAIDLRDPVRKTLALVEPRARGRDVQIEERLPEAPLLVVASEIEMEQVFLNLYMNALDAMPRGGRLTVAAGPADGGWVEATVKDTGDGIPPEALPRLFEPFFTTRGSGGGSGLGLWICRGILRSHGGDIDADPSPGQGARFALRLPAVALLPLPLACNTMHCVGRQVG